MNLAFHQPNYLPNLGFFSKMLEVDVFVVASNIQFEKREGWQRRHKIPSSHGDIWLSVPTNGSQNMLIKDVRIDNTSDWAQKHKKTFQAQYAKTADKHLFEDFLTLYDREYEYLADLNWAIIEWLVKALGIQTRVEYDTEVVGKKQELLVNICKKYGANVYVSGMGGKEYITAEYEKDVNNRGIAIEYVKKNVTAQYPYTSLHYIFTEGKERVCERLGVK